MNINSVVLAGRLTRDPEVKELKGDNCVANIGLAINRVFYVEKEKREETTFVAIEAWGNQAKVVGEYCKKGFELGVEGRLKLDEFPDRETGKTVRKLRVVADKISLGNKPNGGTGESSDNSAATATASTKSTFTRKNFTRKTEEKAPSDIPF